MIPSGELIGMCHMISQVTLNLKQYGCLTCASYTIVVINHLQTLTGGVTLTPFLHRFLKIDENII